jgi:hypothetical protein
MENSFYFLLNEAKSGEKKIKVFLLENNMEKKNVISLPSRDTQ